MIYFLVKALHIGAVIVWIGGTITIAALISHGARHHIQEIRRFYNQVVTPAMLVTWVFGMTLVLLGGWFPSTWLVAKITIVLILSALHGFIARDLRIEDQPEPGNASRSLSTQTRRSWFVAGAAFVVVVLVTFKV